MNKIEIRKHSFDLAKNRLKEFSETRKGELEIDKVQTAGDFFGLGDHMVTGNELNSRLETIQEHLIAVNTTNNKVIKEFREIYNALDVLDRDYISSIVANVKAIEKTSNDVRIQQGTLKQHNDKLASQQSKLDAHQVEIEKNVANISKIVTALEVFKEKLEGYKHLTDIDKIWNDISESKENLNVINNSLQDIDVMWDSLESIRKYFDEINENAQKQQSESKAKDEELSAVIQNNKDEVDKRIAEAVQTSNNAIELLTRKVKYAYLIAGGAAGLAIIELILLLVWR